MSAGGSPVFTRYRHGRVVSRGQLHSLPGIPGGDNPVLPLEGGFGFSLIPTYSFQNNALWDNNGEDALYLECRRDNSALLFNRTTAKAQSTPWTLWALRATVSDEESLFAESRRDFSPLLFNRVAPATATPKLWQWTVRLGEQEDITVFAEARTDYTALLYFNRTQAVIPPPPVTPPPSGGSLPGDVGRGPRKRPGQVFGEADPLSPWIGVETHTAGFSPAQEAARIEAVISKQEKISRARIDPTEADAETAAVLALMRELL